ncbi:MAG: PTS glucose transporter subunit IIA [Rothia sp. (in: high G+C Gram-positive bacteria)]|nr:PTS glucose transporter subunit IIA [Rothia sp. (in: high G+C Gram-positive bacteria)]
MAGFFKKLFGGNDQAEATPAIPAEAPAAQTASAGELSAPLSGTVVELTQVSDQMFASGALGPGAAIEPVNGTVVAPADGTITVAFPTGHAFGIRTDDGLEILIHVGFDTVELDGKFFESKVEKGAKVKRGDMLVEFDLEAVKEAGYPVTTPLVITNAKTATSKVEVLNVGKQVAAGDAFIAVEHAN